MKTAIDWLVSELPTIDWSDPYYRAKLEEAKAMEKQQIMQAVYDGMSTNFDPNMGRAELYYNETFNITDKSDEREQIAEAMNFYYHVYSDENQEKARQALSESFREEYSKSTQEWDKVEESIMRSYELYKEFSFPSFMAFYIEPEDEMKAVEICSHLWPDAVIESGSGEHNRYGFCHYVQVTFDQLSTNDV